MLVPVGLQTPVVVERGRPAARAARRDLGRRDAPPAPRCPSARPLIADVAALRAARRGAGRAARRRRAARGCTTRGSSTTWSTVWAPGWRRASPPMPGQDRVVPYVFPTAGMLDGLPERGADRVHARAGRYCYDTMTLVGPGHLGRRPRRGRRAPSPRPTWSRRARRSPTPSCRPPGHHVTAAGVRRLLLPQQRRDRGAGPARRRATNGSRWSTSTPTTATAPRRCSTTGPTCSTRRCTSTPAPAGSPTTPASRTRRGATPVSARTSTSRCAPGTPATRRGSPRSTGCATRSTGTARPRSSSPGRRRGRRRPREPAAGHARRLRGRGSPPRRARPADRRGPGGRLPPRHLGDLVARTLRGLAG